MCPLSFAYRQNGEQKVVSRCAHRALSLAHKIEFAGKL